MTEKFPIFYTVLKSQSTKEDFFSLKNLQMCELLKISAAVVLDFPNTFFLLSDYFWNFFVLFHFETFSIDPLPQIIDTSFLTIG